MANTDVYLPCGDYENQPRDPNKPSFSKWQDAEGNFLFALLSASGALLMRSETYPNEGGRDNGIDSVIRNRDINSRYSVIQDTDGTWVVILKAGNHQEIARSCPFATEAEANAHIEKCASTYVEKRAAAAPATANVRIEDYLPCEAYLGHAEATEEGFHIFTNADSGQHLFAMLSPGGKVLLRSEEYTTEAARDNGIQSVIKNRDNQARYSVVEENGSWYVSLKAGNHQEIARSCACDSEAQARGLILACSSEGMKRGTVKASITTSAATTETVVTETATSAVIEDYLPCASYENREASSYEGFTQFTDETSGLHYFAYLGKSGHVVLRSEGYTTTKARDNGIESVIRNRDNKDRWIQKKDDKGHYISLVAGNHQEIARTCPFESESALLGWWMPWSTGAFVEVEGEPKVYETITVQNQVEQRVAISVEEEEVVAPVVVTPVAEVPKEKEDDYLPCKEYLGHKVNDAQNNVALFKHTDGQYYFALYNADGSVRLRSEGFRTSQERDVELSGVIKHKDNPDMYKILENGDYRMKVLYDKTGREVGRSCLEKEAEVIVAPPVVEIATAAAIAAPLVTEIVAPKDPEPEPVPYKEPEKTVVYTKPVEEKVIIPPAAVVEETVSRGFNWWWLLLPLLLLGAFLLWKNCKGCKKEEVVPAKVEVPATPAPEPAPAPVAAPTCSCTGNNNTLFNIDNSLTPKTLTKLGTSPEFGSLHGLTADEVYSRMSRWHKKYPSTRKFLDDMFKSMGYTNGFADANAGLYSEALVPTGTTGNMGYGAEKHKTIYATLSPVNDRDLQAFRIKSANGCDMFFMKTCGNHFYFCPK